MISMAKRKKIIQFIILILLEVPINAIQLREYMCVPGTDALASASVWAKLKHHFQEQKSLT